MTKIIGIDDAGRGPVIGPMILAGILIDDKEEKSLKELEVKDSKLIQPIKRRKIKEELIKKFRYHLEIANPVEIDESNNLNYLEAIKTAAIVNKLTNNLKEKVKVFIDCPSVNIISWTNDVQKLLKEPEKIELICEHKADLNHKVVSAASIIAKETREEELIKLRKELGIEFGSGYPADPITIEFIKKNYTNSKYKKIIRFSWKTVKNLIKESDQKRLF